MNNVLWVSLSPPAVYLLSFAPSHLRTGRPTSAGCTLINGNLGERAASRPYTPTTERTAPNEKRAGSGARLRGRQQEAGGEKWERGHTGRRRKRRVNRFHRDASTRRSELLDYVDIIDYAGRGAAFASILKILWKRMRFFLFKFYIFGEEKKIRIFVLKFCGDK